MRRGFLSPSSDFLVIEPLYTQIDKITIPYIYGIGDLSKKYNYVRTFDELCDYINYLLNKKCKLYIYSYNLSILAYNLSDSYDLQNIVKKGESFLKFNIWGLKFRGVSPLTCDVSIETFSGLKKPKVDKIILPDSGLKENGVNWVTPYLESLMSSEIDFIETIFKHYYEDPPLTRASIIRRELAISCNGDTLTNLRLKSESYPEKDDRRKLVFSQMNEYRKKYFGFQGKFSNFISENHYNFVRDVFRGGFMAYNPKYRCKLVENVHHMDLCSSYPAQLFLHKYPMKRIGTYENVEDIGLLTNYGQYWAMLDVILYNVKSIETCMPLVVETEVHKSNPYCEIIGDNYELVDDRYVKYAEAIKVSCTYDELQYYIDFYSIDGFEVMFADVYSVDYLPEPYLRVIMKMFYDKCEYKMQDNVPTWLNIFVKSGLNSCWGFTTSGFYSDIKSDLSNYNNFKHGFEDRTWSYIWGVAVTAYAREAIYEAILACGDKWLYTDTDSIFYISDDNIDCKIERLNLIIHDRMDKSDNSKIFQYICGCYELGQFSHENDLQYFIYYGCKSYIGYSVDGFESAVSRCSNFNPSDWFRSKICNIDDFFKIIESNRVELPIEYGSIVNWYVHKGGSISVNGKDYKYPSGLYRVDRPYFFGNDIANIVDLFNC